MAKRIDDYKNLDINQNICNQHGVFRMNDNTLATVEIISQDSAVVQLENNECLNELIEEFRFYAEHITHFYNKKLELLKEFPHKNLIEIDIFELQPSQFFVNEDKVNAVSSFVNSSKDVVIPIIKKDEMIIVLDGHTRLYAASMKGIKTVFVFDTETEQYIYDFVQEAQRRNIKNVSDLKRLSHEDYEKEWYSYCDNYFKDKKGE
ncbi:MAG: hypothetical protein RR598_09525 [Anaerorhabdus sp.]|uniref:hypothetical protein n=1 Tax=Anaerorhabdus sp. TaxID=1872524 RepID=UPI002B205FC4|nr:hypothetical protein [Anaerorhabdus sp.]MEA4875866.1 hypothetical protein [Anaerorhabdus sp.]